MYLSYYYDKISKRNGGIKMTKMKKIAAMTAALLICAGNMGYMPESTISIGGFTANAAEEEITSVEINEANFPDAVFRKYVADNFDKDGDGVLSAEEIKAVTEIILFTFMDSGVSDLSGIEYFTSLTKLYCTANNLTSLDLSKNTALTELYCPDNNLTSLDLSKNTALTELYCADNNLTSLDLSNNTELEVLSCYNNQITSLDVSNNTALNILECSSNRLTSLDVSNNTALKNLWCCENQFTSLDVSNCTALTELVLCKT